MDSELRYQGEQCQYDPRVCPLARNENGMLLPCAGQLGLYYHSHKFSACVMCCPAGHLFTVQVLFIKQLFTVQV